MAAWPIAGRASTVVAAARASPTMRALGVAMDMGPPERRSRGAVSRWAGDPDTNVADRRAVHIGELPGPAPPTCGSCRAARGPDPAVPDGAAPLRFAPCTRTSRPAG